MVVKRLKKIRLNKGLSQRELSKKSGVSYGHICDLENGKSNPTVTTLQKLATALDVNVLTILGDGKL